MPLFWASHSFFPGEVLQSAEHPHGPPLDPFQQVHVLLVLWAAYLGAEKAWFCVDGCSLLC